MSFSPRARCSLHLRGSLASPGAPFTDGHTHTHKLTWQQIVVHVQRSFTRNEMLQTHTGGPSLAGPCETQTQDMHVETLTSRRLTVSSPSCFHMFQLTGGPAAPGNPWSPCIQEANVTILFYCTTCDVRNYTGLITHLLYYDFLWQSILSHCTDIRCLFYLLQ